MLLQAVFVVEHAQLVFEAIERVQVPLAATFHNQEQNKKPEPHIHTMYNQ